MRGLEEDFETRMLGARDLETGSPQLAFIWVYNSLQIFGLVSVTAVFLTAVLSSRVRRATVWFIFMGGWIIWCISYLLLAGHQTGQPPEQGLCTFQAALVYAGPPANACAALGILLQLYFSVHSTLKHNNTPALWTTVMVNAASPVTYVAVFVTTLVYALVYPSQVQRDISGMYCHITGVTPSSISAALVAVFSIIMLIFEGITFFLLYHNWSAFRRLRTRTPGNTVSFTMIVRISIFSILPMLALGLVVKSSLSDVSQSRDNNAGPNIATATLSGAAGLIFGTQQDILSSWTCRGIQATEQAAHRCPKKTEPV